ncbi:MAG: hypothetical protein QM811_23080 [Pirellulales bacterium]
MLNRAVFAGGVHRLHDHDQGMLGAGPEDALRRAEAAFVVVERQFAGGFVLQPPRAVRFAIGQAKFLARRNEEVVVIQTMRRHVRRMREKVGGGPNPQRGRRLSVSSGV